MFRNILCAWLVFLIFIGCLGTDTGEMTVSIMNKAERESKSMSRTESYRKQKR